MGQPVNPTTMSTSNAIQPVAEVSPAFQTSTQAPSWWDAFVASHPRHRAYHFSRWLEIPRLAFGDDAHR